jgi:hypothetical protein
MRTVEIEAGAMNDRPNDKTLFNFYNLFLSTLIQLNKCLNINFERLFIILFISFFLYKIHCRIVYLNIFLLL